LFHKVLATSLKGPMDLRSITTGPTKVVAYARCHEALSLTYWAHLASKENML
jgi:hypothetical protein